MDIKGMPGYQLQDYILLIGLPSALEGKVKEIKERFAKTYSAPQAKHNPSMVLSAFSAPLLLESKIIGKLEYIASTIDPIKIEMSGFGSFPSHTIYINVTSRLQITQLVKEIKRSQSLLKPDNDHKPYFIDEAHIAVCKKLKPWQYEKAWLEYSHVDFSGRFIADHMVLLRKNEEGFGHVASLRFQGIADTVSQGNLFNQ